MTKIRIIAQLAGQWYQGRDAYRQIDSFFRERSYNPVPAEHNTRWKKAKFQMTFVRAAYGPSGFKLFVYREPRNCRERVSRYIRTCKSRAIGGGKIQTRWRLEQAEPAERERLNTARRRTPTGRLFAGRAAATPRTRWVPGGRPGRIEMPRNVHNAPTPPLVGGGVGAIAQMNAWGQLLALQQQRDLGDDI